MKVLNTKWNSLHLYTPYVACIFLFMHQIYGKWKPFPLREIVITIALNDVILKLLSYVFLNYDKKYSFKVISIYKFPPTYPFFTGNLFSSTYPLFTVKFSIVKYPLYNHNMVWNVEGTDHDSKFQIKTFPHLLIFLHI